MEVAKKAVISLRGYEKVEETLTRSVRRCTAAGA